MDVTPPENLNLSSNKYGLERHELIELCWEKKLTRNTNVITENETATGCDDTGDNDEGSNTSFIISSTSNYTSACHRLVGIYIQMGNSSMDGWEKINYIEIQ